MKNWIKASLYVLLPIMVIVFLAITSIEILGYTMIGIVILGFIGVTYMIIKIMKETLDEKDKKTKLES